MSWSSVMSTICERPLPVGTSIERAPVRSTVTRHPQAFAMLSTMSRNFTAASTALEGRGSYQSGRAAQPPRSMPGLEEERRARAARGGDDAPRDRVDRGREGEERHEAALAPPAHDDRARAPAAARAAR